MQIAVAVTLTVLYLGISLAVGGVPIRSGFPLWFFGPTVTTFCGGLIAKWISARLPLPWETGQRQDSPPRRIHLSWRTAVRLPAFLPVFLVFYYLFSILRMHFDLGRWPSVVVPLVALVLAYIARKRVREARLLREGSVAMAVVDDRFASEWPDEIAYRFTAPDGTAVRGRGNDLDYEVPVGSSVPVYYAPANPKDHVVATACWFESS